MPPSPNRYWVPNAVTLLGVACGLISIAASFEGHFIAAAWMIVWCVLLDRADGVAARLFRATSSFGVQMDSLADAVNFGVAPAVLAYAALRDVFEQPWIVPAVCVLWVFAAVVRLAKFNVVAEEARLARPMFFGVPTTLAAGVFAVLFLSAEKYAGSSMLGHASEFRFGAVRGLAVDAAAWRLLPAVMTALAALMVSNVPTPKPGPGMSKARNVGLLVAFGTGYTLGFSRALPEVLLLLTGGWTLIAVVWGICSPAAKAVPKPAVFGERTQPTRAPSAGEDG